MAVFLEIVFTNFVIIMTIQSQQKLI